jgi:ankyrin repeat protein
MLQLLRRLLRAGSPVDIGDYDKRTALHISAAEGNAVMVSSCTLHTIF